MCTICIIFHINWEGMLVLLHEDAHRDHCNARGCVCVKMTKDARLLHREGSVILRCRCTFEV